MKSMNGKMNKLLLVGDTLFSEISFRLSFLCIVLLIYLKTKKFNETLDLSK